MSTGSTKGNKEKRGFVKLGGCSLIMSHTRWPRKYRDGAYTHEARAKAEITKRATKLKMVIVQQLAYTA